ncbi:hypothetical protein THRCLA_04744 [Thraustotheca clavata]|uniref:Uncharacterized protein n=1 Tax=Thraustotheca clavata TaxID=74557 RepID=A0A1V9ZY63_9STRA|nr:hypothetical protein THRCLA_04744 [Thraustotheca clavata]
MTKTLSFTSNVFDTNQNAAKTKSHKYSNIRKAKSTDSNSNEARKSIAKTVKDCILYLVSVATELLSAPAIKKLLVSEFGHKESKIFNTNVNKILKELGEEKRDDFGKFKGKYHGGESSSTYKKYSDQIYHEEITQKLKDGKLVECCFCGYYCGEDCFLEEDTETRKTKYHCAKCKTIFWTWFSIYNSCVYSV